MTRHISRPQEVTGQNVFQDIHYGALSTGKGADQLVPSSAEGPPGRPRAQHPADSAVGPCAETCTTARELTKAGSKMRM